MTKKQKHEQIVREVKYYFSLVNNASYFYMHLCSRDAQQKILEIVRNEQSERESVAKERTEQEEDK